MPDTQAAPPFETIIAHDRTIACDGGGGPLGHPRVWLTIADREVTCPYCSRHYVLAADAKPGTGH